MPQHLAFPSRAPARPLLALLLLAATACGEAALGTTEQAALNCGDGTYATPCYNDNDNDGRGAGAMSYMCHCGTGGTSSTSNDCDDSNSSRWQNLSCYVDNDDDGHGVGALVTTCAGTTCEMGTTHRANRWADDDQTIANNTDCDDGHGGRYQNLSCYTDADGNHFGQGSSTTTCAGLTCADGVANRAHSAGDCNDGDADIHPHNTEVAANGIDDDCTGVPDEARAIFYEAGNGNTDSAFSIKLKLNSAADLAAASAGTLYARVHYRKLENASSAYSVTAPLAMTVTTAFGTTYAAVTLTGLEDLKVYQARVDLYSNSAGTARIVPASGCAGTSASAVPCSNSDVYYTITKPTGTTVPVKTARYQVVLNALHEYFHFRTNPLGDWDDSLAERFELRDRDQAYCSEFYATAGKPFLVDMNACDYTSTTATPTCDPSETSPAEDYVSDVRAWFSDFASSAFDYTGSASMADRKPGDYLGVNPYADEPDGRHSQMFLAWDAAVAKYWFVEGNGSYSNAWGSIGHTVNVGSTTHCDNSGGWWCPASASECSSGCYYVKTVGALNNSNMLDP